jgi:hypothetical protein
MEEEEEEEKEHRVMAEEAEEEAQKHFKDGLDVYGAGKSARQVGLRQLWEL